MVYHEDLHGDGCVRRFSLRGKVRLMAWAAEEAGAKLQLWGEPPKEVEPDAHRKRWGSNRLEESISWSRL